MPVVRVLSYNVRSMREDRDALGEVIRAVDPDVLCVQEAPRFARWRSLAAQLARRAGLVVVVGGRPAAAQLICSRIGIDVVRVAQVRFSTDFGRARRGTAIAVLRAEGCEFAVACTHLDLVEEPRLRHVAELDRAIARHVPPGVPTVVAADVNDNPGSGTWRAMCRVRDDAWAAAPDGSGHTYSATRPHKRIDGIFVDPAVTVRSARAVDSLAAARASDHLPVLAELQIADGS